jgi:hypothetical protein
MKELYQYRYWILFTFITIIGFLGGIIIGLYHVNHL